MLQQPIATDAITDASIPTRMMALVAKFVSQRAEEELAQGISDRIGAINPGHVAAGAAHHFGFLRIRLWRQKAFRVR